MNGFTALRVLIATTLVFLSINFASCCIGGGSRVKTETKSVTTTLGEELKDLKDAYDQGIISEREYNESRQRILEQRTKDD